MQVRSSIAQLAASSLSYSFTHSPSHLLTSTSIRPLPPFASILFPLDDPHSITLPITYRLLNHRISQPLSHSLLAFLSVLPIRLPFPFSVAMSRCLSVVAAVALLVVGLLVPSFAGSPSQPTTAVCTAPIKDQQTFGSDSNITHETEEEREEEWQAQSVRGSLSPHSLSLTWPLSTSVLLVVC